MWEKYYLLDLSVLMNGGGEPSKTDAMKKEMEALLDRERLLKYRQKKNEKGALQSLGAGLLLQLAVQEYAEMRGQETRTNPLSQHTPQTVLECLKGKQLIEVAYRYGTLGKPYFRDLPLCFSLSHSGEAVFLAASEAEIGADIQHVTNADWKNLAERFYGRTDLDRMGICENNDIMGEVAEKPGSAISHGTDSSFGDAEKRELFYQLWTRKEAYGKLTGEGVYKYLDREVPSEEQGIFWDCWKTTIGRKDYFLSVCRKTGNGEGQFLTEMLKDR